MRNAKPFVRTYNVKVRTFLDWKLFNSHNSSTVHVVSKYFCIIFVLQLFYCKFFNCRCDMPHPRKRSRILNTRNCWEQESSLMHSWRYWSGMITILYPRPWLWTPGGLLISGIRYCELHFWVLITFIYVKLRYLNVVCFMEFI